MSESYKDTKLHYDDKQNVKILSYDVLSTKPLTEYIFIESLKHFLSFVETKAQKMLFIKDLRKRIMASNLNLVTETDEEKEIIKLNKKMCLDLTSILLSEIVHQEKEQPKTVITGKQNIRPEKYKEREINLDSPNNIQLIKAVRFLIRNGQINETDFDSVLRQLCTIFPGRERDSVIKSKKKAQINTEEQPNENMKSLMDKILRCYIGKNFIP